ncbi:paramyosin-like [Cylas formicarius]|uniref:paramyosin-like n=1 Tax=Cylas formicarius TaxID=197179 RepID=UPI002958474E|nr:paramyosin-like [Cylas formicarius]
MHIIYIMEDFELKSTLTSSNTSGLSTCHEDSSLDGSGIFDRCHSENIQDLRNKIDILLKNNFSLGDQLLKANEQISRLLDTNKTNRSFKLESELYGLRPLIGECNVLKQTNEKVESENVTLQNRLKEYLCDLRVKTGLIGELKDKIVQLEVDKQTYMSDYVRVKKNLDKALLKVDELGKLQKWYEDQLKAGHAEKGVLLGKISEYNIKIVELNKKNSILNIKLLEMQNQHLQMSLNNSKEDDQLMEKKNVFFLVPDTSLDFERHCSESEDLSAELSMAKERTIDLERQLERLKLENSELVAKCLVQQKCLSEQEGVNHELHRSKKELAINLDKVLKDNSEKCIEVLNLKNDLNELKVEIKSGIEEKQLIESTVEVIRSQLGGFKQSYERVKSELRASNKRILQLEKEKQDSFMRDNWTVCELAKSKDKDIQIENLKRQIDERNGKLMKTEVELLEKTRDIARYDAALSQYRDLVGDMESKLGTLEKALKDKEEAEVDLKDNVEILRTELKRKDVQLHQSLENSKLLTKTLEKNGIITKLQNNVNLIDTDYETYLGSSTDDTKVKLLYKGSIWKGNGFNCLKVFELLSVQLEALPGVINQKLAWCERKIARLEKRWAIKKKEEIARRVNERKMDNKLKKAESVSRALLGMVKEHLRERQSVEKHSSRLFDENDCLRLSLRSKECQLEIFEKLLKDYDNDNKRLKETVEKLEYQALGECSVEELKYYQTQFKFLKDENSRLSAELKKLQLTNGLFDSKPREFESEGQKSESVEIDIKRERSVSDEKGFPSDLQEPGPSVEDRLRHFENEMKSLKSDKYFLQRLCSDLRVAVTTYMDQNERLSEMVRALGPPSLPIVDRSSNFEDCGIKSEKYIRQLIEESKKSMRTDVISELYECFSVLKADACSLHMRILKI